MSILHQTMNADKKMAKYLVVAFDRLKFWSKYKGFFKTGFSLGGVNRAKQIWPQSLPGCVPKVYPTPSHCKYLKHFSCTNRFVQMNSTWLIIDWDEYIGVGDRLWWQSEKLSEKAFWQCTMPDPMDWIICSHSWRNFDFLETQPHFGLYLHKLESYHDIRVYRHPD